MSYRTHCDWCGECLDHGTDRAVMPVTIQRLRATRHAKWSEETEVTRHFCVAPDREDDLDRDGRDRMGLVPDEDDAESCYDRAIQAITGTELKEPGLGLEWRLVPVSAEPPESTGEATAPQPAPQGLDALTPRARNALRKAGIAELDDLARFGEIDLLGLPGFGAKSLATVREALTAAGLGFDPNVLDPRAFGRRLCDLRESAGMGQEALRRELRDRGFDSHFGSVCQWEAGKAAPSPEQLAALAEIFGVQDSWLREPPAGEREAQV